MASSSSSASMAIDHLALSPFLSILLDDLISSISKEVDLLGGVDKDLNKLPSTVSSIQAVLQDAETKQLSNKAISDWLLKLKDAAYDAVDALDEWTTLAMKLESTTQAGSSSLLSCFSSEQIKSPHKMMRKRMRKISQRFEAIASQISKFDLRERVVESRSHEIYHSMDSPWDLMTSSILTHESEIIGREEDTSYIVRWLLNNADSPEDLSVCSILGMGGLGKTTVAQTVYNDNKVTEYFDVKSWVSVSNQFDLTKLTKAVLDSIPGASCNIEQLDLLQHHLQKNLTGKRFLIILDDVWNENQEEWDRFKFSLRCGAKGSSVIVTTRLETVASVTSTYPPYCLKCLSEEDCWALFKRHAFGTGNEERQALVAIGKEIVKMGGGMPLAAKVLGSLMRFKSEESEWLFIRDSQIWDILQSNEDITMPALRMSYTHLPPQMRQCFAYCSLFPQDFIKKKDKVINLWIANGLIQSREGMEMEDIGHGILNSLVWRSLFQVQMKDTEGNVESFVMHDLVHDLSCFVAKNECCNIRWSNQVQNVSSETRHLSAIFVTPKSSSIPKLRTLIIFKDDIKDIEISSFKCLRALRIDPLRNFSMPRVILDSIGNLKHLRYLDLSNNNFKYLPKAICGLRYLQTLNLEHCSNLKVLPECLSNLSSLRHLNIKGCKMLRKMPKDMGKLTRLQTLSMFIVGADKEQDVSQLERMDSLRGELDIKCLENVKSGKDAEYANLMKKKRINTLSLAWCRLRCTEEETERDVIKGLQSDSNLRKLKISGYQGICFPSWLECSALRNLVGISLKRCTRSELPPSLSRQPFLKTLKVVEMPSVKFLFQSEDEDINGDDMVNRFSSLEELTLEHMSELEDWCLFRGKGGGGGERQMFLPPRLKKLSIVRCPKLKIVRWSASLETLHLFDCNEMVLQSLKNLPRLSCLGVSCFEEVTYFPEGSLQNLIALQSLTISSFPKLKVLPKELGDLSKLTSLALQFCDELVSLPEEMRNLSSIKILDIWRCKKLESVPVVGRSSLTSASIQYFKRMKTIKGVLNGRPVINNL